jgi:glycosyltransferase involved in cell wall biosynthesis
MHVLLASVYHISGFFGGGNEQQTHHLALGLIKEGHKVTYITTGARNINSYPYKIINSKIIHLAGKPVFALDWNSIIKRTDFDVFHAFGSGFPLLFAGTTAKYLKKKATVLTYPAVTNPSNPLFILPAYLEQYFIPGVFDGLATTTEFYKKRVLKRWPWKKVAYIPTILSPHICKEVGSKTNARKKLKLDNNRPTILFVGKLSSHQYYKGVDILLEACKKLPSNYQVLLIGSGDRFEYFKNKAERMGLDVKDKVKFLGFVNNELLPYYYRSADLLVLPSTSDSEGFGLCLIEAMYHEVPTITTKAVGSAKWFNKEGGTLLIPEKDPESLEKAICKVINKKEIFDLKKAKNFAKHFSVEEMTRQTIKFYEELL